MKMKNTVAVVILFTGLCASAWSFAQLGPTFDKVSRHQRGVGSAHMIHTSTTNGLSGSGSSITVSFQTGFDLSSISFGDISLSYGPTGNETVATILSAPTPIAWGASVSGQHVVLTHPNHATNGNIAPGDNMRIGIGSSNLVTNPSMVGTARIGIKLSTGESKTIAVPINDGDGVGAGADVETVSTPTVTIQWAVPQGRAGVPETNDDITFYITVRTADDSDDVILFTQSALAQTNADGTYTMSIVLTGIAPGTYDITIKGHQHLTAKLDNVALVGGNNVLNFTQLDNSSPKGSEVLIAGDVNGAGTDPATLGDDVVNSVDLTVLIDNLDEDDPTGNGYRANVNQDTVINANDLSLLIGNLDETGEK